MTTQLAIGYLAAGHRNPYRPTFVQATEHGSISGRPAIPQAVISWSDEDLRDVSLPVGAGDPAVAVEVPSSFRVLDERRVKRVLRASMDAVMFSVLVAMLLGLAGAVAKFGDQPNTAWAPRNPAALAAIGAGTVPTVDVRVTRSDPTGAPAVAQRVMPGAAATN